jgi:hypothetical protein
VKKLLPWAALIIAVLWVMHDPAGAAASVKSLFSAVSTFASGM